MTKIIYGLDIDSEYTPKDVRDAIVICFASAHEELVEQLNDFSDEEISPEELEKMKNTTSENMIRSMFVKVDGDFDNPTKESLLKVIIKLKEFSINFRIAQIVEKRFNEMKQIIEKLK